MRSSESRTRLSLMYIGLLQVYDALKITGTRISGFSLILNPSIAARDHWWVKLAVERGLGL